MTYSIERETCSRCGGTGRFGPIVVYRGICFKCDGSGVQYTRAGAKVAELYRDACKIPASDLQVGTKIQELGVTPKGDTYWFETTIDTLEPYADGTGVSVTYRDPLMRETCHRGYQLDALVSQVLPAVERQARLAALAPRAGLLLDGEPTKATKRQSPEQREASRQRRAEARRAKKAAVPATEKQVSFLDKLLARQGSERTRDVTKQEASSAIDRFINQ